MWQERRRALCTSVRRPRPRSGARPGVKRARPARRWRCRRGPAGRRHVKRSRISRHASRFHSELLQTRQDLQLVRASAPAAHTTHRHVSCVAGSTTRVHRDAYRYTEINGRHTPGHAQTPPITCAIVRRPLTRHRGHHGCTPPRSCPATAITSHVPPPPVMAHAPPRGPTGPRARLHTPCVRRELRPPATCRRRRCARLRSRAPRASPRHAEP